MGGIVTYLLLAGFVGFLLLASTALLTKEWAVAKASGIALISIVALLVLLPFGARSL